MQFRSQNYLLKNMPDRRSSDAALFALLLVSVAGCDSQSSAPAPVARERVSIAVTSYPLFVMADEIAGDFADTTLVVSGDLTSPDWKPTREAIRTMQNATRILISGGDYEPWLQRVTLPRSRLVDTARGYYDQFVRIPDAVIHQHGPDGSHSHPGVVWSTWLDPQLAMSQLDQTRDVLLEVLPDAESPIRRAADSLTQEFVYLDERLGELAGKSVDSGVTVLGDAPVYQYLTARLGWELNYVHLPAHGPLSEEDLSSLRTAIEEHQPSIVFVRSTLADELAELQAGSEIPLVLIDLCETVDTGQTLVQRLSGNLAGISQVFAGL
jgi:zinc transport system substrate-binding protein